MLTAQALHDIATTIKQAQDSGRQIEPITASREDFDIKAAYAVASLVHRARLEAGATPVGRKIGFTNYTIWPEYGVDAPMWAYVYDTTVAQLGTPPHRCRIGRFAEPKIEPEIVFHFRDAPPPGGDVHAVLACIDWVAHGIEIVQSHFPRWKFRLADTIADAGLHATLLVGEHRPVSVLGGDLVAALQAFTLKLSRDGREVDRGSGANVLGSPLAAIVHLMGTLRADLGQPPLAAGEIVTTGTITAAHPIHAGESWQTSLHGLALPGLNVGFVA